MANENQDLTGKDIARKTLENKFFQDILGSNQVKNNPFIYGQLASNGVQGKYGELRENEEFQNRKENLYNNKKSKGDNLGVYGEPSISDYDVHLDIVQQIELDKKRLSLGELEEITKGIAGGLEDLQEELKSYTMEEIESKIRKAQIEEYQKTGKIDPEKFSGVLTDEEVNAVKAYQALSEAYNIGVALNSAKGNYFSNPNKILKQISEKYQTEGEQNGADN